MHQLGIFDEVRERLIIRRGGVAVFDRLRPRRTAHIVVDLQNGFMARGQVVEVPWPVQSYLMSIGSAPRCDDDELQSILHHRCLCRPNRCRTCRDTVCDGAHFL